MPVAFRFALLVEPVAGPSAAAVGDLADAAADAGFDALFLAQADGPGDVHGGGPDPATLAALVAACSPLTIGIVAPVHAGRRPSVTVRELTTLECLAGPRLAVCYRAGPAVPGEPDGDAAARLLAAARLTRALLAGGPVTSTEAGLAVDGAVNRPPAAEPAAVHIVVDPAGRGGPGPSGFDDPAVDALCLGTGELAASGARPAGIRLLWRATLPDQDPAASDLLGAAVSAGVHGVLVDLAEEPGRAPTAGWPAAGAVGRAGRRLRRAFGDPG